MSSFKTDRANKEEMDKFLKEFSKLFRLTGNADTEKAADYIVSELKREGLSYERHVFDSYFSNPIKASVDIISGEEHSIRAKPRSFGGSFPEGVEGMLVYDTEPHRKRTIDELKKLFKGKIVLSYNYYEDYVNDLNRSGALGLVHICRTDNNAIFEETVGSVWGTPTMDNVGTLFSIPVVGIGRDDGSKLLNRLSSEALRVKVCTVLENAVRKCSLPICIIKGKSDDFVLISGHYDSWHEGISDNAVGNAVCLEIAKIFHRRKHLEKGVVIAWWPGHSNGRYSGSTWYCDNYFNMLSEKCIGHINIDSMGTKYADRYIMRTALTEGRKFMEETVAEITGQPPISFGDLPCGADMSFWGTEIPFHVSIKSINPELKDYVAPGSGGNWWWHTEFDTLDKADLDLMDESVNIIVSIADKLMNAEIFPFDYECFIEGSKKIMHELSTGEGFCYDLSEVISQLDELKSDLIKVNHSNLPAEVINHINKKAAGRLCRLKYSSCGRYEYNNTYSYGTYPGLRKISGLCMENISPEEELFYRTYLQRQKNRLVEEIRELRKTIQHCV
ncbi:MAG: M28 family peptidase [Sedimentibacter sp.]|uniref:M28 family peptidase n=1 Tax=Sedimentibacter sp. TaxID=1960295 RepID=UPI0031593583